ncbi:hypothetical protein KCU81_g735, partial [Aureobasidium melanogenum]
MDPDGGTVAVMTSMPFAASASRIPLQYCMPGATALGTMLRLKNHMLKHFRRLIAQLISLVDGKESITSILTIRRSSRSQAMADHATGCSVLSGTWGLTSVTARSRFSMTVGPSLSPMLLISCSFSSVSLVASFSACSLPLVCYRRGRASFTRLVRSIAGSGQMGGWLQDMGGLITLSSCEMPVGVTYVEQRLDTSRVLCRLGQTLACYVTTTSGDAVVAGRQVDVDDSRQVVGPKRSFHSRVCD